MGWTLARLRPAAEVWPARTITIVVPFPPSGTAENRGGGIGHAHVARAEPEGYTIMTTLPSLAVIPEANRPAG